MTKSVEVHPGQQRFEFFTELDIREFLGKLETERAALLERITGAEPRGDREAYESANLLHWLSEAPDNVPLEKGLELIDCAEVASARIRSVRCGEGHIPYDWEEWPIPGRDTVDLTSFIMGVSEQFEAGTSFAEQWVVEIRVRYTDELDVVLTDRTETVFNDKEQPTGVRFGHHLHLEEVRPAQD